MAPAATGVSDPASPDYDPHSPFYDVTADSSSKYYVGPLAHGGRSGDELRAEAAAQVDDEIAQGWFGKVVDPVVKDQKIQELYEKHLDDARQGLDNGLSLRETGGAPRTLWANATHEQMNQAIVQNANSATIAETSEEWVSVGNELAGHQENLARAISASSSNWQGDAGDAVRKHLAGVGQWLGATAQGATLTGRQQQIHSQTLNETQKRMGANPPVAFSVQEANARLQQTTDPIQYAVQASQDMQQYRAQQAAREHAAQIMTEFDDTIGSAVATPRFPSPPKLPGSSGSNAAGGGGAPGGGAQPLMATQARQLSPLAPSVAGMPAGTTVDGDPAKVAALDSGPGGSGGPGGMPGIPDGSGGSGGSGFGGSGSGSGGSGPGGSGGGFTPPPLNIPDSPSGGGPNGGSFSGAGVPGVSVPNFDDTTTSSGFAPAAQTGGGGSGGFNPGSMPGLNVPDVPGGTVRGGSGPGGGFTPPPFTMPGDTSGGGGLGGPGGTSGLGGPGAGKMPTIGRMGGVNGESIASRLGGGGGGASGLGGIGGGGAGGTGGTLGGRTTGSLAGGAASGAAAAEAEALAARNAAGTAGRGAAGSPGMSGMGGGGARGGKQEEDKEHRLADYVENDDPELFGADEVVAPPVIGDWQNQDWK